jgi:DNA-binding SARP family transcriptional activator
MEFRILGPVEAWDGAEQLDLGGSKPRALLAVLLLHANQVVSTDQLVDELWSEAPPPTARNLVQGYVSRLRQALQLRGGGGEEWGGGGG